MRVIGKKIRNMEKEKNYIQTELFIMVNIKKVKNKDMEQLTLKMDQDIEDKWYKIT